MARLRALPGLLLLALLCCRAPPPDAPAAPLPGTAEGSFQKELSFSLLEDYDKGADLDSIAEDFLLMHDLGIDTWRGSFGWDDYEPEPGSYDFDWLERFVQTAALNGIMLRPYIAYTPAWAAGGGEDGEAWNDPPRDLDRWRAFVTELVRTLGDWPHVLSWEIYNEVNAEQWWEGTRAEYAQTLDAAAGAIRAEDPDARIILGGFTYPDTEWLAALCEEHDAGADLDVVAFHAYPETWTPPDVTLETFLDGLPEFLDTAREGCGVEPVWINETGYATTAGRTEVEQANWWARAIASFAAAPGVEHIGVYEIRDLDPATRPIGDAPNHHLGLLYNDGRRKLAFHTVDLMTDLLDVDTLVVADGEAAVLRESEAANPAGASGVPGVRHHLFVRPDRVRVLVLWSPEEQATVAVALGQAEDVVEYGLSGDSARYERVEGGTLRDVRLEPGRVRIFRVR